MDISLRMHRDDDVVAESDNDTVRFEYNATTPPDRDGVRRSTFKCELLSPEFGIFMSKDLQKIATFGCISLLCSQNTSIQSYRVFNYLLYSAADSSKCLV